MAYTVRISNRFKKQFRLCMKRGLDMELTLLFLQTGTHSDLF